jgi:hypothetical protein
MLETQVASGYSNHFVIVRWIYELVQAHKWKQMGNQKGMRRAAYYCPDCLTGQPDLIARQVAVRLKGEKAT